MPILHEKVKNIECVKNSLKETGSTCEQYKSKLIAYHIKVTLRSSTERGSNPGPTLPPFSLPRQIDYSPQPDT